MNFGPRNSVCRKNQAFSLILCTTPSQKMENTLSISNCQSHISCVQDNLLLKGKESPLCRGDASYSQAWTRFIHLSSREKWKDLVALSLLFPPLITDFLISISTIVVWSQAGHVKGGVGCLLSVMGCVHIRQEEYGWEWGISSRYIDIYDQHWKNTLNVNLESV